CALQHDGRALVQPAQFFGPLQGYQPTLPAPPRRTLRVPAQSWTLALASDLRSSLAVYFLEHGRLLAADGPSTSSYAANALLPMSAGQRAPGTRLTPVGPDSGRSPSVVRGPGGGAGA